MVSWHGVGDSGEGGGGGGDPGVVAGGGGLGEGGGGDASAGHWPQVCAQLRWNHGRSHFSVFF